MDESYSVYATPSNLCVVYNPPVLVVSTPSLIIWSQGSLTASD